MFIPVGAAGGRCGWCRVGGGEGAGHWRWRMPNLEVSLVLWWFQRFAAGDSDEDVFIVHGSTFVAADVLDDTVVLAASGSTFCCCIRVVGSVSSLPTYR